MCRVLSVTEQGFYAWQRRGQSKREGSDRSLCDVVLVTFHEHKRRYGSIRLHRELNARGHKCGRHKVARLMREQHLRARATRKYRVTTDSSHGKAPAENVLQREFLPASTNRAWAGDITYLWTMEGWMYLAVFIDLFSRKVVGWALSKSLKSSLVLLAFERALARRRPSCGLIVHTDRGRQYVAADFLSMLQRRNITLSMSRKANCWDNAVAESFFHTLKVEAIHGERFETRKQLEQAVFEYIELYYNRVRMHSTLDYISPDVYERETNKNETLLAA